MELKGVFHKAPFLLLHFYPFIARHPHADGIRVTFSGK